jgi:hypothetical protein
MKVISLENHTPFNIFLQQTHFGKAVRDAKQYEGDMKSDSCDVYTETRLDYGFLQQLHIGIVRSIV